LSFLTLESDFLTSLYVTGMDKILFGQGFGGITDFTVDPDSYLYIVSIGQGKMFRILPQWIFEYNYGMVLPFGWPICTLLFIGSFLNI